ncbi:MAG: response regulator transcription factor [Candidatus Aminicenantes bacterium]|nr:response regulator transcription factor [Candidatus Aminicenantes bacterium]MDH5705759.1 response regulator transcription factor [Candidatus Aminicenantes bacterium]
MKVLIVDDSRLLRERLVSMISELPEIDVIAQAGDAAGAKDSIQEFHPDVVILDIRLSEGNGIEVLQDIKKKRSAPVTIMFTNYPYPQYRKKCKEAGADFFFDKSTEFHKITGVLEKINQESPARSARNSIKRKEQKTQFYGRKHP